MSFNKLTAFTQKVADAADQLTGNTAETKAIFDAAPEELRTYFNNLVDALKSTASGDSGAKNTGATAITGLTGNDIQSLLESLKTYTDNTFAKKIQTDWIPLELVNGWSYYGNGPKVAYRKNELGEVFIKGQIKGGQSNGYAFATLPSGYRPKESLVFFGIDGANAFKRIDVESNGNISLPWTVNNAYLTINLPPFKAEQ